MTRKELITTTILSLAVAAAPAYASDSKKGAVVPEITAGKGQIVFYRTGGLGGAAVNCTVYLNGEKVSSLGGGRYFTMQTDPGSYKFTVKSEAKKSLALDVAADETQYVRCKIKAGFMVGRPKLEKSDKADFDKRAPKLKLVDLDDMGALATKP